MPEYRCNTEGCSAGDCENCLAVAELRAATSRVELPGGVESQIVEWANPETCPSGRADDAMIHLTAADKTYLGTLTLGWLREHTSVKAGEDSLRSMDDEDDASESGEEFDAAYWPSSEDDVSMVHRPRRCPDCRGYNGHTSVNCPGWRDDE